MFKALLCYAANSGTKSERVDHYNGVNDTNLDVQTGATEGAAVALFISFRHTRNHVCLYIIIRYQNGVAV